MKLQETAVLIALTNAFENKKLAANRAVPFAVDAYKLAMHINKEQKLKMEDKETIAATVYFIKEIAKGADGIMGTRDDLIDATTLTEITDMLERSFIEDVLAMVTDAIKSELTIYKTSFCFMKRVHFCLK